MKTSKIIFISLLIIMALYPLAKMIDIRVNGILRGPYAMINKNKLLIPPFKVLIINNSTISGNNIVLNQNDSSFIKITWMKDSLSPRVNYTIKEDTLIVSDLNPINYGVEIYSTNLLTKIILKKATISVKTLNSEKLTLDLNDSKVYSDNFENEKFFLNVMEISARNYSRVYLNKFKVDSMNIVLQNSNANLNIIARIIRGELTDNSKLESWQQGEIYLKKDSTSKFSVR